MSHTSFGWYVGIDWATQAHQVILLDAERQVLGERSVPHTGGALAELADWLTAVCGGAVDRVAVAIEMPRGTVVETLLERGFAVFALNPKQLDRFRDRYTVAGAKDDRRDALVLAASLITDQPAFRPVRLDDPQVIRLRELARLEAELHQEEARLTNRLRDLLHRIYPQVLRLSPAADEPWVWALLELAPTPVDARQLTRPALSKLLRAHRIRRLTADTVLAHLQAPPLRVAPGTVEAVGEHIGLLIPRVRLVHEQRAHCRRRLERVLATMAEHAPGQCGEHRDVEILRSLPGVGRLVAATMLAEASQLLAQRDYHALRAQGGIAPVTRQSGTRARVDMRYHCNHRLRNALYHWGRVSAQCDRLSRQHYQVLRGRGHNHGRAVRGVVDRLLLILMAMLRSQTSYDPTRRRAYAA
jgi:transposase